MSPSTKNDFVSFELPADFDLKKQSIALPDTKKPGQTAVYRHAAYPKLIDYNSEGIVTNLVDFFQVAYDRHPTRPCLGFRKLIGTNPLKYAPVYTWLSYIDVDIRRRNVGSALEYLWEHGRAGGGELPTIGIWSQNRAEYQIIDLAGQAYAKVTVALYDTLGVGSVEYICNHAEISVVFVAANHLPTILSKATQLKYLKVVVCVDELPPDALELSRSWASSNGLEFFTLLEFESLGRKYLKDPIKPASRDQICTICYTSGTTGNPKGVLLSHGQLAVSCIRGLGDLSFSRPARMLSYLPVAHIYGKGLELSMIYRGVAIGFFTGDPTRLFEDAQVLQPTFFPAVPRILNRIYQAANSANSSPGLKGELYRRAVATKQANFKATGQLTHPIWDRLVFSKIQAVIGGKVEIITCGSAPISPECLDFTKIALACGVYEGEEFSSYDPLYGMTETTSITTRTVKGDKTSTGTTGPPNPLVEVKLVDVPSMGYTSDDKPSPRGELCSRGVCNTKEYYRDPEATAKLIDADGWLHTGDIAELDSCGRFKIIDRIKNIIKLSQGEFVALEKIQNVYSAVPLVSQIYVHGSSLRDYLVAVVVPDTQYLIRMASTLYEKTVNPEDVVALAEIAREEQVKTAVLDELTRYAKDAGLRGFETVKDLILSIEPFAVENGLLTPTLKVKRRETYEKYKQQLDALYETKSSTLGSTKL